MFATISVPCPSIGRWCSGLLNTFTHAVCFLSALSISGAASASPGADICLASASRSAAQHGIPEAVMQAITTVESGKLQGETILPWPWTVEADGKRRWFSDRDSAQSYLGQLRASGRDDFFVGCFQLSHLSHAAAFASSDEMIDPARNADFAARFLLELRERSESWEAAARLFRIANPIAAPDQTVAEPRTSATASVAPRMARRSTSAGLGSLVPVTSPWQEVD